MDRALVTAFPGPGSYTGEDVVEIHCHGGVVAPSLILQAFLDLGARQAEPGEFTRRAYLNGKMDLLQAEAVADLVNGRSRALHRVALRQLDRGLSHRIAELRAAVVELEALLAHHIDFPEEDEPPTPVATIGERAGELVSRLEALLATAPEGELLRAGAVVVLAGAPNAGKSSLFNAMAGVERALVTEIPGTTRDAVELDISISGYPFRLVDTAGLRETEEVVERMGIEVASRYLASADAVLFCRSADPADAAPDPAALEALVRTVGSTPVVLVETKVEGVRRTGGPERGGPEGDAESGEQRAEEAGEPARWGAGATVEAGLPTVRVSAHTGAGLDRLRSLLLELVFSGVISASEEVGLLTRERQRRGVEAARDEVRSFALALARGVPAEFAGTHLKSAVSALEEVVGEVTGEDVLDQLFRNFCVGK
jgi:tRNA modification GTPase